MGYVMFIIAFIVGYPLFMISAYVLGKLIFVKIDETDQEAQEKEKLMEVIKAKRIKTRRVRLAHAMKV